MAWYKTGTVAVTNGSTAVTGTGTAWLANARRGDVFLGPDNGVYEIADAPGDGSITLAGGYRGSTTSGGSYAIAPTHTYIRELTTQVAALIASTTGGDASAGGSTNDDRRGLVERGLMTKLWSYRMPGKEPVYSSPVGPVTLYSGGTPYQCVLFTSWDWHVYALKVSDGTLLWRYATGSNCYGRCQAADVDGDGKNEVFAPSHDGSIHSLDSTGTTSRWTFQSVYGREGSGTATAGTDATTLKDSGKAWAPNAFLRAAGAGYGASVRFTSGAASGQSREITVRPDGQTCTTAAFSPAPAAGDTYVIDPRYASDVYFMHAGTLVNESGTHYLYATGLDNHVYKLNANTGALAWKYATLENIEPYPLVADVNNDGALECVVASLDGKVRALNASTGALLWEQTAAGKCDAFLNAAQLDGGPALEVIAASRTGRVYSLSGDTGAVASETTNTYGLIYGDIDSSATPVLIPGESAPSILAGGDAGGVWCFNADMSTRWQRDLVPTAINSSPVFHDVLGRGRLSVLIGDMRGTLHCFDAKSGAYIGNLYTRGGIEGVPLYADIDGDGKVELVITTLDGYVECYRFTNGAAVTSTYKPGNSRWAGKQ